LSMDQDALARVLTWSRPAVGEQRATVGKLSVLGARIALHGMEPVSLSVDAQFAADGSVAKASLKLSDGSLAADLVPKEGGVALTARGNRFIAPLGPAYVFDNLELTATVTRTQLRDVQAEGSIFGGKFKANGQADYGNGIVVEGRFGIDGLNIEPLLALFAKDVSVTGSADLKGAFSLRGDSLTKMFDQDRAEFSFSSTRGTINNVDFTRAAQAPTNDGVRGGRSRYNTMSGLVRVAGNRASFQQVRIASDSMSAAGAFEVLPKGELAGRMNVRVGPRGTVLAQSSVAVTGDVRNPVLR